MIIFITIIFTLWLLVLSVNVFMLNEKKLIEKKKSLPKLPTKQFDKTKIYFIDNYNLEERFHKCPMCQEIVVKKEFIDFPVMGIQFECSTFSSGCGFKWIVESKSKYNIKMLEDNNYIIRTESKNFRSPPKEKKCLTQ